MWKYLSLFSATVTVVLLLVSTTSGQPGFSSGAGTWPYPYPGLPDVPFSPIWQKYFKVTQKITNVTYALPSSYAGNIPVDRPGHPNNTLFFWAFERETGSLNNPDPAFPIVIWLQGGPGTSSLIGLAIENGPIRIQIDGSTYKNPYGWNTVADMVFLDNPVGVGYSTADDYGQIVDEDMMAQDFIGFITNFLKVFPALTGRPFYLVGESYAGVFISYIAKAVFSAEAPPIRLGGIAAEDAVLNYDIVHTQAGLLNILKTYPALIAYNATVYQDFEKKFFECGYNVTLTYPQHGPLPAMMAPGPLDPYSPFYESGGYVTRKRDNLHVRGPRTGVSQFNRHNHHYLERRAYPENSFLNPWYGCELYEEMWDFVSNFTYPWNATGQPDIYWPAVDYYDMPDATFPKSPIDPAGTLSVVQTFFNDPATISALHAPKSGWAIAVDQFQYNDGNDPSPPPMDFINELFANASTHGVRIIIYSGNKDTIVGHYTSEITIQNVTFCGTQGFNAQPGTPWYTPGSVEPVGIVHQECNVTYALFFNASHMVPQEQPQPALVFLTDFILGNDKTGSLLEVVADGEDYVIGGDLLVSEGSVYPLENAVYYGNTSSGLSTLIYSEELVVDWYSAVMSCGYAGESSSSSGCRSLPAPQ